MNVFRLSILTINENNLSIFGEVDMPKIIRGGMLLTDRIDALNLRLRESAPRYKSDWHVAGDPTLIIVQQGVLRIVLRDESYQDFGPGEHFVAQDYLPEGIDFDHARHGHRAEVIGNNTLQAVHIKLAQRI